MEKKQIIYIAVACSCIAVFLVVAGLTHKEKSDGKENENPKPFILTAGVETTISTDAFRENEVDAVLCDSSVEEITAKPVSYTSEETPKQTLEEICMEYHRIVTDVNDYVRVRTEPSTQGNVVGRIYDEAVAEVVEVTGEDGEEWFKIISGDVEGFVKAEFFVYGAEAEERISKMEELVYARTMEDIRAEQAAGSSIIQNIVFPKTQYSTNEELRRNMVEYALQYVGYAYVRGGSSLATGTDCSGFTCFIYQDFGYSIDRTPQGQYESAGRSIDYTEIQPGDIICYSSNGGASCTHVAIYIGDGQIVHAANSRKGVIIGQADYSPIIDIRNVIDS